MSYTALYRKWRPKVFADVKGQEPIVKTLQNQIKTDRVGHAYLFCGSRGTGKTTLAKIFAKTVNCEHPIDGEPCGCCDMCKSIDNGSSMNVFEIDAASNNGVDFVREIIEETQYPPSQGRYLVYIIDEVHMFSSSSFNALLKTLEEPPSYVIFILATTESHKIPTTILSRCQQYDFRRIDTRTIIDRLKQLCEGEGIETEEKAIEYIARKANGGLRDAISLLDQAAISSQGKLTYENVLSSIGAVDTEIFSKYFRYVADRDVEKLLLFIDEIIMGGSDIAQFAMDFAWYLRNMLLAKASDSTAMMLDISNEDRERLTKEAQLMSTDEIIRLIRMYSACYNEMRLSSSKRVLFEVTAIKSTNLMEDSTPEGLETRISALENKINNIGNIPASMQAIKHEEAPVTEEVHKEDTNEEAIIEDTITEETAIEEKTDEPEQNTETASSDNSSMSFEDILTGLDALSKNLLRDARLSKTEDAYILEFEDKFALDSATSLGAVKAFSEALKARGTDYPVITKVGSSGNAGTESEQNIEDIRKIFPDIEIKGD